MNKIIKITYRLYTLWLTVADKYRFGYYQHLHGKQVVAGSNVAFGRGSSIVIFSGGAKSQVTIGENVTFRSSCYLSLDYAGQLTIEDNCFFNNGCSITCLGTVHIGRDTLFGENVRVYDHNHRFRDSSRPISQQGFTIGKVSIGENCWIGSNVTILSNVTIGDNVVIGANSLIYKSVPSNTIVKADVKLIFDSKQ